MFILQTMDILLAHSMQWYTSLCSWLLRKGGVPKMYSQTEKLIYPNAIGSHYDHHIWLSVYFTILFLTTPPPLKQIVYNTPPTHPTPSEAESVPYPPLKQTSPFFIASEPNYHGQVHTTSPCFIASEPNYHGQVHTTPPFFIASLPNYHGKWIPLFHALLYNGLITIDKCFIASCPNYHGRMHTTSPCINSSQYNYHGQVYHQSSIHIMENIFKYILKRNILIFCCIGGGHYIQKNNTI